MIEREMEDLIAAHAEEFFPRHVLVLKGRQGTFAGVGRFDLLFEDQFENKILMELKAVAAKLEAAEQLVRYKQALEEKGERNVIMWLVSPVVPKPIADFLDRFGVEYTEIHEAQFRQVASRHDYRFASEAPAPKDQVATPMPSKKVDSTNRESAFHQAMLEIYERAKTECHYNASATTTLLDSFKWLRREEDWTRRGISCTPQACRMDLQHFGNATGWTLPSKRTF